MDTETKKTATKKKAVKKATKKTAAAAEGRKGRTSAYTGKKIYKLVETEATGLRATGQVRECWDAITKGITVETYREKAPESGLARRVLANFIAKGFVEVK